MAEEEEEEAGKLARLKLIDRRVHAQPSMKPDDGRPGHRSVEKDPHMPIRIHPSNRSNVRQGPRVTTIF
uniref:Uncharacterized protein n=1 Tax=Oryza punctata TaxID=4537 RepID=A0A0E0MPB5_ORYPU